MSIKHQSFLEIGKSPAIIALITRSLWGLEVNKHRHRHRHRHKHTSNGRTLPPDRDAIHTYLPLSSLISHTALSLPYTPFLLFLHSVLAWPVAWALNHALPISAHSSYQHVLGTLASHRPGMPQERRCASRPIVTRRAALTVHTSQSYHRGIDNTSSHLVKQLTKHSLYPFLKSDSFSSLARVSSAQTASQGVPAIQPIPSLSDDLSSVCVSVCSTVPHLTRMALAVAVALQPGASMQGASSSIIQEFILHATLPPCHRVMFPTIRHPAWPNWHLLAAAIVGLRHPIEAPSQLIALQARPAGSFGWHRVPALRPEKEIPLICARLY
jgi:hypothetical protein